MLRINFDSATTLQIKKVLTSQLWGIKYIAKREGIYTDPEWEYKTSPEYPETLSSNDIDVCKSSNNFKFPKQMSDKLIHIVKEQFPSKTVYSSGHFYYPPTGYMGWHTNYKVPGTRLYITLSSEEGKSFFRYKVGDQIITDYDDAGLTIREFSVPKNWPFFWHCVGSNCDRFSFGYRLCDTI